MTRTKVFISYSHKDEDWKHRLSTHLGVLEEQGLLELWCDRDIEPGRLWAEINANFAAAKIAVLLISANFPTSKFLLTKEVTPRLTHHEEGGMRSMPVLMKDSGWEAIPWLRRLQMYPRDAKPIIELPEAQVDGALAGVARELFKHVRVTKA